MTEGAKGPLPKRLSQSKAKKLLTQEGWTESLGGKHNVKMTKPGHRPITLPMHKGADYSPALTADILREAGLKGTKEGDDG